MAETSVPVQPAPAAAAPTVVAAPVVQLKMVSSTDAAPGAVPGVVISQAVTLVDDLGRPYQPMTEATGRKLAYLLNQLCRLKADATGSLYSPPDEL